MTEGTHLLLSFVTEEGGTKTLRINNADPGIGVDEVRTAMTSIIQTDAFYTLSGPLLFKRGASLVNVESRRINIAG